MHPLTIPVPPQLEAAVCYHGDARFWALSWTPSGDECMYDDGHTAGTGHWSGYLAFIRHPAVALELDGYNMGSSDSEAEHWLIIDRLDRVAFIAPADEARRFLRDQWPEAEPLVLTQEEWAALVDQVQMALEARPMPTQAAIPAAMQEQQRLEAEMAEWLDATPQAQEAAEIIRGEQEEEGGSS